MILNNRGATLPQVLLITAIVGALSVAIMQAAGLANRLKAQNEAALTMDKIINDMTEKLADPEVCGVVYRPIVVGGIPSPVRGETNQRYPNGAELGNFHGVSLSSLPYKLTISGLKNVDDDDVFLYGPPTNASEYNENTRVAGFVMVESYTFDNFLSKNDEEGKSFSNGDIFGEVDLKVRFYKRRTGGMRMLGTNLGVRTIRLSVLLNSSRQIKKCFSINDNITLDANQATCNQVGGSFHLGQCFFQNSERERILATICDEMYGDGYYESMEGKCPYPGAGLPECLDGITGFNSSGIRVCR